MRTINLELKTTIRLKGEFVAPDKIRVLQGSFLIEEGTLDLNSFLDPEVLEDFTKYTVTNEAEKEEEDAEENVSEG